MADPIATNESYEIKRIQMMAAAAHCPPSCTNSGPSIHRARPMLGRLACLTSSCIPTAGARITSDYRLPPRSARRHRKSEYVLFADPFYGPESDFEEGTPQLLQNVGLNVDGLTKIFDNSKGLDPLHIAFTQAVELDNSVTTSVKNSFTFDTTTTSARRPSRANTPGYR